MRKTAKVGKTGGRPTRARQLEILRRHIEEVRSGAYLRKQEDHARGLEREILICQAARGFGSVKVVEEMLAMALHAPDLLREGMRARLIGAGLSKTDALQLLPIEAAAEATTDPEPADPTPVMPAVVSREEPAAHVAIPDDDDYPFGRQSGMTDFSDLFAGER